MKIKAKKCVLLFPVIIIIAACSSKYTQLIETIEVTRIVPNFIIETRVVEITSVPTSEISGAESLPLIPNEDPAYFDGIITITRYYTFLGHGLYEEAYQLLSSTERGHRRAEEYIEAGEVFFKAVQIHSIQPYYVYISNEGGQILNTDTDTKKRFVASFTAWGAGEMSGSVPSGQEQTIFIELIKEGGEWLIDSFSTAPIILVDP